MNSVKNLQNYIHDVMQQKKIRVKDIEESTGLNKNTIYKILSGQSKNPSASNLQLIAKALSVSLESLITLENDIDTKNLSHEEMKIFLEATDVTVNTLIKKDIIPSVDNLIVLIKEVYQYSIKASPPKVEERFIHWLLDNKSL